MSDRLTLSNAFEEAGIDRRHAEHLSGVVFEVIRGNVATKADLDALGAATKADIAALAAGTKAEIATIRSDLDIAVRDVKLWTGRLLGWLLGLQLVGIGLLIRYLPHG